MLFRIPKMAQILNPLDYDSVCSVRYVLPFLRKIISQFSEQQVQFYLKETLISTYQAKRRQNLKDHNRNYPLLLLHYILNLEVLI
jgi:hypothetical protein